MLLAYVASLFPHTVEKVYAAMVAQTIIPVLSRATGLISVSLAETAVVFFIAAIAYETVRVTVFHIKGQKVGKTMVLDFGVKLLVLLSLAYFVFILLWGLNYYRSDFADLAHLTVKPASTEDLAVVCENLIGRMNALRTTVDEDRNGIMRVGGDKSRVLARAQTGYRKAAGIYPELGGNYGQAKGIILSVPMSYLGITGFYFPFTGEANVNMAVPDVILPATACHEMAHQRGFAREDEANYIAYVTCNMNPDSDFQYSGTLLAVLHSMNMLKSYDCQRYMQLQENYSKQVRQDLNDYALYWARHEGMAERLSTQLNDLYLKSNRQAEGVYSYNRMVDLLIAEYRAGRYPY